MRASIRRIVVQHGPGHRARQLPVFNLACRPGDRLDREERLAPIVRPRSGAHGPNNRGERGAAFFALSGAEKELALEFLERRCDQTLAPGGPFEGGERVVGLGGGGLVLP